VIRPSLLNRAEVCGLVPLLAEQCPETSEAAAFGRAVHAEIVAAYQAGRSATIPEAQAALDFIEATFRDCRLSLEQKVQLLNGWGETVTEGTPDLVALLDDGTRVTIDWKTGRPDNVPAPDDNLQLMAYGLAVSRGAAFKTALVFLSGDRYEARWSEVYRPQDHPAVYARVLKAASAKPEANPGDHCGACYQRLFCPSWQSRLQTALAVIDKTGDLTVDDKVASALIQRVYAVREAAELAENLVKAHVRGGGACIVDGETYRPSMQPGRETADLKAMKADGLDKYVKRGADFEKWRWTKVKP
jgi:hypothetical protein